VQEGRKLRDSQRLAPSAALPAVLSPMLLQLGSPFDSDQHLFEIKWDGYRTMAWIDGGDFRLVSRRGMNVTERYPELEFLREWPAGTVLDGELIVFRDGVPDFWSLQGRDRLRTPIKIKSASRLMTTTYIAFDILYDSYRPMLTQPLLERRERLRKLLDKSKAPIVLSEGVIGPGTAFFREACDRGLEGVVAKRLDSRYVPGKRTGAWIKIKRGETKHCAIVGFVPAGPKDFHSLILAAEVGGAVRYVGRVATGIDDKLRSWLSEWLRSRQVDRPVVPCRMAGTWVSPGLFRTVSYLEMTPAGEFRAPVFRELFNAEAGGARSIARPGKK
jgi:bifunctional non-homologous end joining protein LigD